MTRYWLCCGSTDLFQHKNCTEHLIGHPERRRFGTAEEHKEWLEKQRVTEVFNNGTEAYYKIKYDFSELIEKWTTND